MRYLIFLLIFSFTTFANEKNLMMCGGSIISYDNQYIYLNFDKEKHKFNDKVYIKENSNNILSASLPSTEKIEINLEKMYLSYSILGKDKIKSLCKKI